MCSGPGRSIVDRLITGEFRGDDQDWLLDMFLECQCSRETKYTGAGMCQYVEQIVSGDAEELRC